MTRFLSLARATCCSSFVLLLAGACGGQSFKGGEGDAGSGGTAQTAGSKATGGSSSGNGTTAGTGSASYDACQVATDCVLGSPRCCGVCDGPNVTAHDFIAYNKQYAAPMEPCPDLPCGPCPPVEPRTNTRPYFVPNCVRGECVVEDIRESDVTACQTAADCRLRNGTSCCEGCGNGDFVAVRRDGSLEELVCGGLNLPCLDCVAVPPDDLGAQCSGQGHCVVRELLAEPTP